MPLELAANEFGFGRHIAILHGLFGSGRNWRSVAPHLAARHRVLTFDLRNHGASPWADGMSYGEMVEDLRASLRARGIDHAALVGHSMGGKAAMLMALLHPAEVDRLVVVDIAPAANPPNLLAYIRAMRAVDLRGVKRRAEVDVALAAAVSDPAERAFLLQNLLIDENAAHWRLNLKAIERDFPQILGFPDLPAGTAYPGSCIVRRGRPLQLRPTPARTLNPAAVPAGPDPEHRRRRALGSRRAAASLPAGSRPFFPLQRRLMLRRTPPR